MVESVQITTYPKTMLLVTSAATLKSVPSRMVGIGVGTFVCQRNLSVLVGIQLLDSIPEHLVMEYVLIRP